MTEPKLEINGKEYTFIANRKAACLIADLQNSENKENMLDDMFYALLKRKHNLTREEVSDLLDYAEEEYGVTQLLQFATEVVNEAFTQAEKKQYKTIEFLNRKK